MPTNVLRQQSRYWIGVVSASHVKRGVLGGFAQLCHGKSAPLRRMSPSDWLIYYSPRTDLSKGEVLQAFTAIGQVADDRVYEYQMSESFVPFRRNIRYIPCREVRIAALLDQLSFTRGNRNWGYNFRYGHFEIGIEDFLTIADAMMGDVGYFQHISQSHRINQKEMVDPHDTKGQDNLIRPSIKRATTSDPNV